MDTHENTSAQGTVHSETHPPGSGMSPFQVAMLQHAAAMGHRDPSWLSDLEAAGMVAELEKEMARFLGVRHVLALSSGTAALHAALLAFGIGQGDEVIVTPYSWGQSVSPVLFTGATPVFADILPDTLCLDPQSVSDRIGPRTKAILPVHLFGEITPMGPFLEIARKYGLAVIADGAHALGAEVGGISAARFGDVCCYSLGRGKLVSGGEGGLLATDDTGIFQRAMALTQHPFRSRREFGFDCDFAHDLGLNYRLHPLAAALAVASFYDLHIHLAHRRAIWTSFNDGLGRTPALRPVSSASSDSWAAYGLPLSWEGDPGKRHIFTGLAQEKGVPLRCGPVRSPLHIRIGKADLPFKVKQHPSHLAGSCPVAEAHCADKELWALSALDIDIIDYNRAHSFGLTLKEILSSEGF